MVMVSRWLLVEYKSDRVNQQVASYKTRGCAGSHDGFCCEARHVQFECVALLLFDLTGLVYTMNQPSQDGQE